jgi:DNA repair protein RadC
MKERVFQLRLDGEIPVDITPPNFYGFRYARTERTERFVRELDLSYQIKSPTDAAQYFIEKIYTPFHEFQQEEMWVLLMNTKNYVTHDVMLYRGTLNACAVRIGEIFREAITQNAAAILVAHNHPSGDPTPSAEDVRVTNQIYEASKLLEIELLDHVIIGNQRWASLRERTSVFSANSD